MLIPWQTICSNPTTRAMVWRYFRDGKALYIPKKDGWSLLFDELISLISTADNPAIILQ